MINTKARHQEIYAAAAKALENAGGVREIDNLSQDKRKAVLFSMATSVIATANTTRDTARRNIAKAMRRARFAIMQQVDPARWGGPRVSDKLGRPPMPEAKKRQRVSTQLAPGSKELAIKLAADMGIIMKNKKTFSTVIRFYNQFDELIGSEIVDSTSRSGASRKANNLIRKETFFKPIKKINIDNYQYWNCYDRA